MYIQTLSKKYYTELKEKMIDLNRLLKIKSHIDHNNNKLPHTINPTPKKPLISHHAKKSTKCTIKKPTIVN